MTEIAIPLSRRKVEDLTHRAAVALQAGQMGSFEWDLVSGRIKADALLQQLFNLPHALRHADDVFRIIHPDDLPNLRKEIERCLSEDKDYDARFRIKLSNGNFRWIGGRGRVVERDESGAPLRVLGVNWDLGSLKANASDQGLACSDTVNRVFNNFSMIEAMLDMASDHLETVSDLKEFMVSQLRSLAIGQRLTLTPKTAREISDGTTVLSLVEASFPQSTGFGEVVLDIHEDLRLGANSIGPMASLLGEVARQIRWQVAQSNTVENLSVRCVRDTPREIEFSLDAKFEHPLVDPEDGLANLSFEIEALNLRQLNAERLPSKATEFSLTFHLKMLLGREILLR